MPKKKLVPNLPVRNSWPAVTARDIDEFQSAIGFRLPADYREFLLRHNGGNFEDETHLGTMWINALYGLNTGFAWSDLKRTHDRIIRAYETPIEFLPFANDPGGDKLVLKLAGRDRGSVWYFSHDLGDEDPFTFEADSFTKLAKTIRIDVEPAVSKDKAFQAIEVGDLDRLKRLLKKGIDVNHRHPEDWAQRQTLLMSAIYSGRVAITEHLLDAGADCLLTDQRGRPAAFYACPTDSKDCLELLLDHGVSPDSKSEAGLPLLIESLKRSDRCFLTLLARGADPKLTDAAGKCAADHCEGEEEYLAQLNG